GQPEDLKLPDIPGSFLFRPREQAVKLCCQRSQQLAGVGAEGLAGTWARSSTLSARRACSSLTRYRVEVGRVRSAASVRRCSPASSSAVTRSGRPRSVI